MCIEKPDKTYIMIETLLPGSKGKAKFLELWATPGHKRPGWTSVVFKTEPIVPPGTIFVDEEETQPFSFTCFDSEQEQREFESISQNDIIEDEDEENTTNMRTLQQPTATSPLFFQYDSEDEFEDPDDI